MDTRLDHHVSGGFLSEANRSQTSCPPTSGGSLPGQPQCHSKSAERKGWHRHPSASSSRRGGQRSRVNPCRICVAYTAHGMRMSTVWSRQPSVGQCHDPLEVIGRQSRYRTPGHVEPTDRHRRQIIENHPGARPSSGEITGTACGLSGCDFVVKGNTVTLP